MWYQNRTTQSILCHHLKVVTEWNITDKNNKSDLIIFLLEIKFVNLKVVPCLMIVKSLM